MEKFDSITHFLETGGFNYRIFELGRKVMRLSNQLFQRIENQKELYPYPFQQKAWLALVFWKGGKQQEAVIWFLQFPIDELGFLKQESRDHFLIDLLEQTAKNIQAKQTGEINSDELNQSPFAFKPSQERLAMFHALVSKELNQDPSRYYQATREYLKGKLGYEQWQFLGLQGVADVVARVKEDNNEALLIKAIAEIPEEPLVNLCYALENIEPTPLLTQVLITRLECELTDIGSIPLLAALLRALSGSKPEQERFNIYAELLDSSFGSEIEILAAISGRAWKSLESPSLLMSFVTKLAEQEQFAFNAILADLMMLPKMREAILKLMRDPKRSDQLASQLNDFMQVLRK